MPSTSDYEIIEQLTHDLNDSVQALAKYEIEGWLAPKASPQFLLAAANVQSAIAHLEMAKMYQMQEKERQSHR